MNRILLVEDNPNDAELIEAMLAGAGIACTWERVETREAFVEALERGTFDLILSDYSLPAFDGLTALGLTRERCPELPFIVVSGTLGEEAAIESLKQGATDYVMKQRLTRLVPAVERALREREERAALRCAEQALRAHQERLRNVVDIAPLILYQLDATATVTFAAGRGLAALGLKAEELLGRPLGDLFPNLVREGQPLAPLATVIEVQDAAFELRHVPLSDPAGGVTGVIGIALDVSEQRRSQARIHQLAFYDHLTGLPNRALLEDRLALALLQAHRAGRGAALVFLDLDRFKSVNDTLGHPAGDRLLQATAERLSACLRESDTAARWAGDEFVLLLPDLGRTQPEVAQGALLVADKVRQALAEPFSLAGHELQVTASLGIALFPWDADQVPDLIKHADTAMFHAKSQGRNHCRFFTAEMNRAVCERLSLEHDLRRALKRGELVLDYQPQVDTASGLLVGAEALLRWEHPERGRLPPAAFIPLAEETGQILAIGEWVLREAARQINAWQAVGLIVPRLAVNVSPLQVRQPDFVERVWAAVSASGLPRLSLEIELTESVLMEDSETVRARLLALKDLGFMLCIDDFGTGYSSLRYLKRWPVDMLKIDQSFVREMITDPGYGAVVRAILALAKALKLGVVAEGVETDAQLAFLQQYGCEACQGYYFSRPVSAGRFAEMLTLTHHG